MADRSTIALAALGLAAVGAAAAYLGLDLRGDIGFALELRGLRLAGLVTVAIAVAVSTVLFQTVAANRLLTPSIMGVDALHVLGQTVLVAALGALGVSTLPPGLRFAGEAALLAALTLALFTPLLRSRFDMTLLLLAGVVAGVLFRSLSAVAARMLDPNDYAAVQALTFANFNAMRPQLLTVTCVVTFACAVVAWRARHRLDVLALGRDAATGLGLDWGRSAFGLLALTSVMVAASTALVGPIVFLGLLVVAIAERALGTRRHALLLPGACLAAIALLVGAQALLQHGLGGATALGVVIELVGGVAFLALLLAERRR